jgi:hypothetical protein
MKKAIQAVVATIVHNLMKILRLINNSKYLAMLKSNTIVRRKRKILLGDVDNKT